MPARQAHQSRGEGLWSKVLPPVLVAGILAVGGIYHDDIARLLRPWAAKSSEKPEPGKTDSAKPVTSPAASLPAVTSVLPVPRHKVVLTIPADMRASARFTADGKPAQVDWNPGWVAFHLAAGSHLLQAEDDSQTCTMRVVVPGSDVANSDCQPRTGGQ